MPFKQIAAVLWLGLCAFGMSAQEKDTYALKGTIIAEDGKIIEQGVVAIHADTITEVRAVSATWDGIATQSYILPGFIDLHNHITWNVFPRWRTYTLFSNRYEWQQRADYKIALSTPRLLLGKNHQDECKLNEYAEIKALVGGATSTVGSLSSGDIHCIEGLVRNLDFASGIVGRNVNNEVFPFALTLDRANTIRSGLSNKPPVPFLAHVAEGKSVDAASAREFTYFVQSGFLRQGASIIHGVALKKPDFEAMATAGVGLIWSPRSNIELYGETADVATAKAVTGKDGQRITIALAPDWSPSGSDGLLQELKYAAVWNAGQGFIFTSQELVSMVTSNPARLAGLADKVGAVAPHMLADLVLIRQREDESAANAFDAITQASPQDVRLVVVGGIALYGDTDLMSKLHPGKTLESLSICGAPKSLYLAPQNNGSGYPEPWKEVSERLSSRLNQLGTSLAPLVACSGTNLN
jgi:5-methylthioadenosine/S-adenosylhomocysteine deaminase